MVQSYTTLKRLAHHRQHSHKALIFTPSKMVKSKFIIETMLGILNSVMGQESTYPKMVKKKQFLLMGQYNRSTKIK